MFHHLRDRYDDYQFQYKYIKFILFETLFAYEYDSYYRKLLVLFQYIVVFLKVWWSFL